MELRELLTARNGKPVGRYAPSPTGYLHLGNLRTALEAWTSIRRRNGIFILRIEDIDHPRTIEGAETAILEDLRWIGLDWDEGPDVGGPAQTYRQSDRSRFYDQALTELRERGLVFPCTCSRKDLRSASSAPHGSEGPVYPGTCRKRSLNNTEQSRTGHAVSWRFRVDRDPIIRFQDLELGDQEFDLDSDPGDFVVQRRDGLWAYQLACAVDDALMGVTEIIRGADLLSSTPRQIAVMRALELPVPTYKHVPLVADENGTRLSKRDASCSLRTLREAGMDAHEAREIIRNAPTVNTEEVR